MSEILFSGGDAAAKVLEAIRLIDPARDSLYAAADDIGFGRLYADVYRDSLRYNETSRSWYCYDGRGWTDDPAGLAADGAAKLLQRALLIYSAELPEGSPFKAAVLKLGGLNRRKNMILDAASF